MYVQEHNIEQQNHVNIAWFHSFTFTGKERDVETGYGYFGARYMDHELMTMWLSVDPMSDKYPSISPYAYCAWNPVKLVDPDGRDWYEIVNEKTGEKEIKWTDYHSQVEMDNNKQSGTYLGKAVVVFDGYNDESLGTKQKGDKGYDPNHSDGYIDGRGSKSAKVTVYGPKDDTDIQHYTGYTMSSDPYSFGVVADGDYIVNKGPKGPYGSTWAFGEYDSKHNWIWSHIPAKGGFNPRHPKRNPAYLNGVFIHPCNKSGWAGTYQNGTKGVSEGCLLIHGSEWNRFTTQLQSINSFVVRVNRK